jgi:hypothetical protein
LTRLTFTATVRVAAHWAPSACSSAILAFESRGGHAAYSQQGRTPDTVLRLVLE